jgi:hypothetical protein
MIVGLFKKLKFSMNMKLHANQYGRILEETTEKKVKVFYGKTEEEKNAEEAAANKEEGASQKEGDDQSK